MSWLTDNSSTIALYDNGLQTLTVESEDDVLSDDVVVICRWVIYTTLCQSICLFGIATNIINVICFLKQGFKDPVNVSLLGLSLSDIGCLLTMSVVNICFTPSFTALDLPFDASEMTYMAGGMPHTAFSRVTGWYTALITLERCLCVSKPLKVKMIFTSKRMTIILVCTFVILVASVAPVYVANRFGMKFFPDRNKTLLGIQYAENRDAIDTISYAINNILLPCTAFVIIITCTFILVIVLHKKTEWRQKAMNSSNCDNVSNRNRKVAKMVVMISSLFIACYIPIIITFLGMCLVPEMSMYGKYHNVMFVSFGIGLVLESVNSSVNIFIYYHMSSRYREIVHALFGLKIQE